MFSRKPGFISPVLQATNLQDLVDSPAQQCARLQLRAVRAKSPLNLPNLFAKQANPGRTNKAVSPAVGRLSQVIVSRICGAGSRLAGAPGGPPGLPSHLGKVNKRGPACACVVDYSMYSHNHGQANLSRNQNSASKLQTHACSSSTGGHIETRGINDGGDGLRWLLFSDGAVLLLRVVKRFRYIGPRPPAHPPRQVQWQGAISKQCIFLPN